MIIIIMGVAGSGKTTIGSLLARKLEWQFLDADQLHSPVNQQKMRKGIPLTDEDRQPWLQSLRRSIYNDLMTNTNRVYACSALKSAYRQILYNVEEVKQKLIVPIFLRGTEETIKARIAKRNDHFFNPILLHDQFKILELPLESEAFYQGINLPPNTIVNNILTYLKML